MLIYPSKTAEEFYVVASKEQFMEFSDYLNTINAKSLLNAGFGKPDCHSILQNVYSLYFSFANIKTLCKRITLSNEFILNFVKYIRQDKTHPVVIDTLINQI